MSNEMKPGGPTRPPGRRSGDEEPGMSRMVRSIVAWLVILGGILLIVSLINQSNSRATRVSFNEYQRLLDAGLIEKALVLKSHNDDHTFQGDLKRPTPVEVAGAAGEKITTTRIETMLPPFGEEMSAEWREKIP